MTTIDLTGQDRSRLDALRARLPLVQDTFLEPTGGRAPAREQFYTERKATPSGAIGVHTAESGNKLVLPDLTAGNVASFIRGRGDAGSYHSVSDLDDVVRVGRYEWQMFHEGTGGNRHSIGLSLATDADRWPDLVRDYPDQVRMLLAQAALAAADAILWLRASVGIDTPRRRITAAEYHNRTPGFCDHGRLDPHRRRDPGLEFPWDPYLERIDYLLEDDDMTRMDEGWPGPTELRSDVETLYVINGQDPVANAADIDAWTRDLVDKGTGQKPGASAAELTGPKPTYAYIDWELGRRGR